MVLTHSLGGGPSPYNSAKPAKSDMNTSFLKNPKKMVEPIVIENDTPPESLPKSNRNLLSKQTRKMIRVKSITKYFLDFGLDLIFLLGHKLLSPGVNVHGDLKGDGLKFPFKSDS